MKAPNQTNQRYFAHYFLLIVLCAFVAGSGCKRQSRSQVSDMSSSPGSFITGQVFIVTRGAENVRLGQLKVCLVPRGAFDELHLREQATAKVTELSQALAKARTRGDESERLVSEIKANYSALLAQREELVSRLSAVQLIHAKYAVAKEEVTRRDALLGRFKTELGSVASDSYYDCRQIVDALEAIPRALVSAAHDHLVPRSNICKTDADGRFRFECAPNQDYVLFTRGHRQTLSGAGERYEWFISARPSTDEKRQVLLTNDNVVEGVAGDNLMRDIFSLKNDSNEVFPPSQSRRLPELEPLPVEPHWAPTGVYFLLTYSSVPTTNGVTGVPPGTQVKELRHAGDKYSVQYEKLVFEVPLAQLTDNSDVAQRLRDADGSAQAQIALWQNAQHEIEQQNKDAENREYDEEQRRIQENYKRLHRLTGESRLNDPAHP